ncbi:hypothetical protein Acsp03_60910 [Actinomadura sp. NBRC 104412]|uniref:DUF3618 domain-containing protein n=1 Tax=unclassified Actinomadura TaxID=2626254 RepID=UPI0024A60524|nr:DUF3618 domain-containing protein [Actinomadura sp. NBRC 104412]GLZ08625.1 hypothetical protein Acsp03_60910 [Actinomadura sp. NBRC 104412]
MADRSRDPETLERRIERTRLELAQTIDELAQRVSPSNVAQRGAERLKEEAGQVARAVGAMMRPSDGTGPEKDDEPGQGGPDPRVVAAVGVGAAVVVTALVVWRRRRRRR